MPDASAVDGIVPGGGDGGHPPRVLICERDPHRFTAAFFGCLAAGAQLFLANPDWGRRRLQQAWETARPHRLAGERPAGAEGFQLADLEAERAAGAPPPLVEGIEVMVPTGGSTGGVRFAMHSWATLEAAARAFLEFFGQAEGGHRTCCLLPLFHVSGLMQVVRALVSGPGGEVVFADPRAVAAGERPGFDPGPFFLSLVPTQLRRLLAEPATRDWLTRFDTVLVGGANCPAPTLDAARQAGVRLAPSYGLTETAALVTALRPEGFLAGRNDAGRPLPGTSVFIREKTGMPAAPHSAGQVIVRADGLCFGTYPDGWIPRSEGYSTGDEGLLDAAGHLHILRRSDRTINTGGEKVDPVEVELAFLETDRLEDVYVAGRPDPEWGERLVVFYVPSCASRDAGDAGDAANEAFEEGLRAAVRQRLGPVEMPKEWVALDRLPRNEVGKVDREALGLGEGS